MPRKLNAKIGERFCKDYFDSHSLNNLQLQNFEKIYDFSRDFGKTVNRIQNLNSPQHSQLG